MRIRIHCECDGRVSKQLHHYARVDAFCQEKRGCTMAQIVKTELRQFVLRISDDPVELAKHIARIEHRADAGSENHAGFLPSLTSLHSFLLLAHLLTAQSVHYKARQANWATTLRRLRFHESEFAIHPL